MDSNGYPGYGNGENGYVPGYDQASSGAADYSGAGYQDPNAGSAFYQGGASDSSYQSYEHQQPQGGIGEDYSQPQASASSSSSLDDEWFNNILGVDEAGQAYTGEQSYGYTPLGEEPKPAMPDAQQQAQYTNPGQTSYRPSGSGPNNNGRPSGSAPRTSAAGGKGGNGGGKKMKLNRNGYMFIAFVAILLICLIIVIALIARGCSNKAKPSETVPSATSTEEMTVQTTIPTTQATLPDPSAPIGYFKFSEYIGYRTWWDLFHYVYNINIDNNSDPMIAKILEYNKLDPASYTGPNPNDRLLLPPKEVLTNEIPITFNVGSASETTAADGATTTTQDQEIVSQIHIT